MVFSKMSRSLHTEAFALGRSQRGKKEKREKEKKTGVGVMRKVLPQWTSVFLFRCFKQFGTNIH